jgi:phosphate transport system permease protein
VLAVLDAAGGLHFRSVRTRRNLFTGETTLSLAGGDLALGPAASERPPRHLRLDGTGDTAYLVWDDGRTLRIDAAHPAGPRIAETLDLVPEAGSRVTALEFLVGKTSLLVGDDAGRVRAWYRVRREDAAARDGATLLPAHELPPGAAAVTALAASSRSRMAAAGYADGTIALFQITGERRLAALRTPDAAAVAALALSPREGLLTAVAGDRLARWDIDAPHNESSLKTLLAPVWYEGYDAPAQVWQSTGGTDDFEPKYGLAPLIFGTLKATFYSMLFGLPIALLAAIYTSEFLHPRVRARVKPAVEMMASLPSVVLGFLAALVFAPVLADRLPTALAALVAVPFVLLLGAHVWQLLPARAATRLEGRRLLAIAAALPLGLLAAAVLGGPLERLLYAGDIMAWLDGQVGDGRGGWLMLLLPLSALAAALVTTRLIEPTLRRVSRSWSRTRYAAVDLVKFLVLALLALASAWLAATVLDAAGWDPRGHVLGTYVQRNALVVGFVMGFAVIPIIYTIAEDALGAVPDHLRAASLGAGATTWQTAIRVVVPPAMSGLFSAVMVGLGRAVGETMIVLMAAGNTPILDANLFNGFRTLSANIAVELPEAVQHSTHYRTLFLAALTLFAMTFVLNTVAEIVRLRFRRKAYQL